MLTGVCGAYILQYPQTREVVVLRACGAAVTNGSTEARSASFICMMVDFVLVFFFSMVWRDVGVTNE